MQQKGSLLSKNLKRLSMKISNFSRVAFLATVCLCSTASYAQQDYPNRPVRLLVPYPPGGPTDGMARIVSNFLTKHLGQNVVVDNRGGAATAIGAELAKNAPADGYTLFLSSETTFAVNPALRSTLPYDPQRDFAPISLLTTQPYVLAASLGLPAKSVKELVVHAKANPGKVAYGSAGTGGGAHLAGEMFKQLAGIDIVHVPYKGNGPAIIDLISGQVGMMIGSISSLLPHANTGKLRLLAVAAGERAASAPSVPTFAEAGFPGYQVSGWNAIVAPRGAPPHVIKRVNAAVAAGFKQPEVSERLKALSIQARPGTPGQLAAHIKSEFARYHKLIKSVGLKVD